MPARMMLDQAELPEFPAHVRVKRNTRARRMALRFDPKDRTFHLVLPPGTSMRRAHRFAEEHDKWMRENLRNLPKPIQFKNGAVIPVFGRERLVEVTYDKTSKTTSIELKSNKIKVLTNLKDPEARIQRFLKAAALEELEALSRQKARRIRQTLNNVSVRDTKSRWGSCNSDGNICYSWRLIFAPYEALDYVVAHEVAHLRHLDHSLDFWDLCRKLSDDYFEGHYWMYNHGSELMRYGAPR
ncbi:MAG: M48 family metallopeptidase [Alphaproteobacteria bacterium]|nr:M48 family metallopeptidase [Alphaproteobacteria bacterium]